MFYPLHGVAEVVAVESRDFGDQHQDFYVLELDRGGKLLLPTSNLAQAAVRGLVSPTKARELLKKIKSKLIRDRKLIL